MASMDSALDSVKHFLRMVVTSAATSCSARLLWLEMSMMIRRRPFRTDSMHLKHIHSYRQLSTKGGVEAAAALAHPLVFNIRSTAAGMAASRPLEPSGVAEPMLAKISSII